MTHPSSLRFACEGVEKMRGLVVFLLAMSLVGCASLDKFRTTNRQNLNRLSVGMSKSGVHQVMGNETIKAQKTTGIYGRIYGMQRVNNPYRSETLRGKDGKNYEVLFYYSRYPSRTRPSTWAMRSTRAGSSLRRWEKERRKLKTLAGSGGVFINRRC